MNKRSVVVTLVCALSLSAWVIAQEGLPGPAGAEADAGLRRS